MVTWCFTPSQPVQLYQGKSKKKLKNEQTRKGYARHADVVAWLGETSDLPSTQHGHGTRNVAHWNLVALEKK